MKTQQKRKRRRARKVRPCPHDAITCTINDARHMTGLGKTKIGQWIKTNQVRSWLVDNRRLIDVQSLRQRLTGQSHPDAA